MKYKEKQAPPHWRRRGKEVQSGVVTRDMIGLDQTSKASASIRFKIRSDIAYSTVVITTQDDVDNN